MNCKCGCTERIKTKKHHKYEGVPDYLPGHQFRGKRRGKNLIDLTVVKYCKCGCGSKIKLTNNHRWNGIPDYISGHNSTTKESKQDNRERFYSRVPKYRNTKPELKLQEALKKEGIEFETQKTIYGLPDIFVEPNICIFADGDYWHNLPGAPERDRKVTETLVKNGYKVYRFWEHEINNNIENCVNTLKGR